MKLVRNQCVQSASWNVGADLLAITEKTRTSNHGD